ncbi:DUF3349 domain-containing protein [Raineyella fluvialis]|uniref:DUF3349 domain-containing protein n=1 Tax=Raineyella fluvialis TaxID=2662261 RepID=A0A5Q2FFK2_9ACTN|nr:DUF3349 domain-containing protein [Raineyella fluvialis]QGF24567.1 DUF3349 domain-containing protein [Raineyella fluvialis]
MPESVFHRVVEWLRAGYPQGIPENDYIALYSILHRTLTKEEIETIVRRIAERKNPGHPVSEDEVREMIRRVVQEEPEPEDVRRVSARLAAGGWPLAGPPPR